jgi:hypothetical protein
MKEYKLSTFILAAFSLSVIQSWNQTVRDFLNYYVPKKEETLLANLMYTITITLIFFIALYFLNRMDENLKK